MHITNSNLSIRNATAADAEQLCLWWNDGNVMAHAGFVNGLGTSAEKIRASLAEDDDKSHRCCIIELDSVPIGEMNYRNKGDNIVEIGIKICDTRWQNKGFGTKLLTMFINSLFNDYAYEKVILDTNLKNTRAQYVYEKLGFRRIGISVDSWKNQVGELQSSINYELNKKDFFYIATLKEEPLRFNCCMDFIATHFGSGFFNNLFKDSLKQDNILPQGYMLIKHNKIIGFAV